LAFTRKNPLRLSPFGALWKPLVGSAHAPPTDTTITREEMFVMAGRKILMLVGDFTEEYEIFVFEQAMHAVGHIVHVVCPDKKAGEIISTSLHDFEGHQTYTEKLGHNYTLNKTFSAVKPAEYDAVYIAGGRGPEYIRIDKRVQAIIRHFHEADKPIFTICHGVQVLMAVPETIRGKEVAALQFCEPEVTAVGGIYVDVSPTGAHVDGKLVSAKGWTGLAAFMKECLAVLGTEIRHGEIKGAKAAAGRRTAKNGNGARTGVRA
jgi:protease I